MYGNCLHKKQRLHTSQARSCIETKWCISSSENRQVSYCVLLPVVWLQHFDRIHLWQLYVVQTLWSSCNFWWQQKRSCCIKSRKSGCAEPKQQPARQRESHRFSPASKSQTRSWQDTVQPSCKLRVPRNLSLPILCVHFTVEWQCKKQGWQHSYRKSIQTTILWNPMQSDIMLPTAIQANSAFTNYTSAYNPPLSRLSL